MHKKSKRINRNLIIGIIVLIVSIILLTVFVVISSIDNLRTSDSLYPITIFSFVFGILGGILSLQHIFVEVKNDIKRNSNKK